MRSRTRPALSALALFACACASSPSDFSDQATTTLVDDDGVALEGYDAVSYFLATGPVLGDAALSAEHGGATYRFASAENRSAFLAEPERFAPAYGGWCAWAIAEGEGSLVDIDPRAFLIQKGRLLLFYENWFAHTRKRWLDGNVTLLAQRADRNWERLEATLR